MLCDVALFGEVKLPEARLDDYLCSEAREALLTGFTLAPIELARQTEAVLEELKGWSLLPPEWLEVSLEGSSLKVRGLVSRDTFLSIGADLASLWHSAAPFGGGGSLMMVGLDGLAFGFQIRAAFGRGSVRTLNTNAVQEVRASAAVATLRDGARWSFAAMLGEGAGAPFTGATL